MGVEGRDILCLQSVQRRRKTTSRCEDHQDCPTPSVFRTLDHKQKSHCGFCGMLLRAPFNIQNRHNSVFTSWRSPNTRSGPVSRNKDKMAEVQDPDERPLIKVHAQTKVEQHARFARARARDSRQVGKQER